MVIAGPNVSIDREIGLGRLDPGHIHRAERVEARIGGGGVNAARAGLRLGARTTLLALLPEEDEHRLSIRLAGEGIDVKWARCRGQARVATIVREGSGRMSVLNEPGAAVGVREWEAFVRLVRGELGEGRVLLCSGSLPPGPPRDAYARLAREARHAGSRCVIDAAGATLAAALDAGEGIVVPNIAEAEGVLDGVRPQPVHPEDALERAAAAARRLLKQGAHAAVVTAGGAGAAYAERGPRGLLGWRAAPEVEAVNPIGAGDAFAAALALQIQQGARLDEAVELAVVVAAEHVGRDVAPVELSDAV